MKDLRAKLEADGWQFGAPIKDTGVDWYAWKRLQGAKDCACNDKPPSLIINPWSLEMRGKTWQSVDFEVTGELGDGRWINFKAYSVTLDEAYETIPRAKEILLTAWNAVAA